MKVCANIVGYPLGFCLEMVRSIGISHVENCPTYFLTLPNKSLVWGVSLVCAAPVEVAPTTFTISTAVTVTIATASFRLVSLVSLVAFFLFFGVLGGRRFTFQLDLGLLSLFDHCALLVRDILRFGTLYGLQKHFKKCVRSSGMVLYSVKLNNLKYCDDCYLRLAPMGRQVR